MSIRSLHDLLRFSRLKKCLLLRHRPLLLIITLADDISSLLADIAV